MFELIVLIMSICAGFFTGLLGVGGGIIIFPAFLYIIPLLGFKTLPINLITGITTVQILAGSFFAYLSHRGESSMEFRELAIIGASAALGCLSGAIGSVFFSQKFLLALYLTILIIAFLSMTVVKLDKCAAESPRKKLVSILCYFSGIFSGALGLGGAVLYIPILRYFYCISTKDCVANVTFIVFSGAILTFIGKAATSQIPYYLAIFTLLGSLVGAKIGAYVNKKLESNTLKKILLSIIIITGIRVFISLIFD